MSILFPRTVIFEHLQKRLRSRFMYVKIPVTSIKMTPLDRESTTDSVRKEADIAEKNVPWASLFTVKRPFAIARTLLVLNFCSSIQQKICHGGHRRAIFS
jgi:hypothetical protein